MKRLKVLQVNKLYYPEMGGVESVVQNIAEGLQNDIDMQVLVCQKKGKKVREIVNGVPVYRAHSFGTLFSMPISLDFLFQLRKLSKDMDIIHFHMPFPLGDIGYLLSGYKGKVVVLWHSDVVKQKRFMKIYKPIMNCFLKKVDIIIVGAQGIIDGSHYLQPYRDKCKVIPLAIREEMWQDGELYLKQRMRGTVEHDEKKERVNFLFVGRLVYYKGCDVLLRALQRVERGYLTIVGTGDLEEELRQMAQDLEIEGRVCFAGPVPDDELKRYFRETDVFVLPSVKRSEAFGLVQLEAMAYGKPVINTNLPSGVPDVSLHGITGLTVEAGDAGAMADAMNWLIAHPKEMEMYGKAAKKRVDEVFKLDKILPQIYEVYKSV